MVVVGHDVAVRCRTAPPSPRQPAGLAAVQQAVGVRVVPDRARDACSGCRVAVAEVLGQVDRPGRQMSPSTGSPCRRPGRPCWSRPPRQRRRVHLHHVGRRGQTAEEVVPVLVGASVVASSVVAVRRRTAAPSRPPALRRRRGMPSPLRSRKIVSPISPSPASCPARRVAEVLRRSTACGQVGDRADRQAGDHAVVGCPGAPSRTSYVGASSPSTLPVSFTHTR